MIVSVGEVWGGYNWYGNVFFRAPDNWDLSTNSHVQIGLAQSTSTSDETYVYIIGEMTRVGSTRLYYMWATADHSSWGASEYVVFIANSSNWNSANFKINGCTHYTTPVNYGFANSENPYLYNPTTESNGASVTGSYSSTGSSYDNRRDNLLKKAQNVNLYTNGNSSRTGGSVRIDGIDITSNTTTASSNTTNGTSTSVSYRSAISTTVTLKATPSTGYDFEGWYSVASGGTAVSTSTTYSYTCTSERTLYARFKAKSFSITYKDQGNVAFSGVHGSGYPTTHTYGTATTLVNPTKTGYKFMGWYTNSDCSGIAVTTLGATAYTSNITLYAKWAETTISATITPTQITANQSVAFTFNITFNNWVSGQYYTIGNPAGGFYNGVNAVTSNSVEYTTATGSYALGTLTFRIRLYSSSSASDATLLKEVVLTVESVGATYTISTAVASGQSAWGSVTPASVSASSTAWSENITATPSAANGFGFDYWTATTGVTMEGANDGRSSNNPLKVEATQAGTVTAHFKENTYSVATAVNNASYGTVTAGPISCKPITPSAEITATPAEGCIFTGWTKTDDNVSYASTYTSSSNPVKINAKASGKTLTANFGVAPVTGFAYGYEADNRNSWQQPISGDGTMANPYQVYKTKNLKLRVTGVTTTASDNSCIMVKYGSDTEQAYSGNGKVIECNTTGNFTISVKVYNKKGSTEGSATTKTIYYTVIEAPTATITCSASTLSVIKGTNITMTATLSSAVNETNPYKFYFKSPNGDWSDTGCTDYKSANTHNYTPSIRGMYQYYAFIKDAYNNIWQTNTISVDVYEQYTVTFNPNTGTCGTPSNTVYSNGTYGDLPEASKSGYVFKGWYTAASGGTKVESTTSVTTYSDHSIFAQYEQIYTVTIEYKSGDVTIASKTMVNASESVLSGAISAPEIIGYTFSTWSETSGVTYSSARTNAGNSINATIPATITAEYTERPAVYFRNTLNWNEVYVTYDSYWDAGGKGSGNNGRTYHKMTRLDENSDIWYDYIPASLTNSNYANWKGQITFNDRQLGTLNTGNYNNFSSGRASYRADFDPKTTLFVPLNSKSSDNNGCAYYSNGYWMKYNSTSSGYTLKVWTVVSGSGTEVAAQEFTALSAGGNTFTAIVNLPTGSYTYGFKAVKDYLKNTNALYYSNNGTMTKTNNGPWEIYDDVSNNCGITTTAAGDYIFTLTCGDGRMKVSVEYPVSVNDYRVVYIQSGAVSHAKPSGIIRNNPGSTDIVSFFINKAAGATSTMKIQKCTSISGSKVTWTDVSGGTINLSSISESGVYNFAITQPASGTPTGAYKEPYSGEYYIRTSCSDGGWNAYRDYEDNLMTYSEYSLTHGGYTHYYMKYAAVGTDVSYTIANDYSPCISDTLYGDTYTNDALNLPATGSVRFTWNETNNALERAYLSGSTYESDYFLVLRGNESNKLYTAATGSTVKTTNGTGNWALFSDNQNWVYQADVYAEHDTYIKLTAKYNNKIQYFKGSEPENNFGDSYTELLVGGNEGTRYHIRVVYDFKTNRLVAGWIPDDDAIISTDIDLDASLLFIRNGNEAAKQLKLSNSNITVSDVTHVYVVLQVTESNWNSSGGFFWFSLPYECKISDIFGMGEYGSDKDWVIQRYRGDLRAEQGWWKDTPTFWRNLKKTATLEANRGYVLYLANKPEFKYGSTTASLYFPSKEGQTFNFTQREVTTTLPYNECTICRDCDNHAGDPNYDRRAEDSHWYIAGVPTFQSCTIKTVTPHENLSSTNLKDKTPLYFYEWNWSSGAGSSANYTARTTSGTTFKSTHSYMFQFAGSLTWQAATSAAPAGIIAHRQNEEESFTEMSISLERDEEELDHTYVTFVEGATEEYDLGADLSKIVNEGSQIYSFAGQHILAANVLPHSTTEVPLGIVFAETGQYAISMPQGMPAGKQISVYDNVEDREFSMENAVTIYADSAHTSAGRYFLRIQEKQDHPTSVGNATPSSLSVTVSGGRLFVEGLSEKTDVMLYDMTGRLMFTASVVPGEGIMAPQQGIYLLRIADQTLKINVR